MTSLTVPGVVAFGCSGIRIISRFSSAIFADLAMRGFAISFSTLTSVALMSSFLRFLSGIAHRDVEMEGMQSHFAQSARLILDIAEAWWHPFAVVHERMATEKFLAVQECPKLDSNLSPAFVVSGFGSGLWNTLMCAAARFPTFGLAPWLY